jgi:hypothetical protein
VAIAVGFVLVSPLEKLFSPQALKGRTIYTSICVFLQKGRDITYKNTFQQFSSVGGYRLVMENPRAYSLLNPENTPDPPSVDRILPKFIPSEEPCYTSIDAQSQELLFNNLIETFEEAQKGQETHSPVTIQSTSEQEDPTTGIDSRKIAALQEIVLYLDKLWRSDSIYFQKAVEALANGSRDRKYRVTKEFKNMDKKDNNVLSASWRIPYGKAGILTFFLNVISSKRSNEATTLHSLRLIGNSCADTGEPRCTELFYSLINRNQITIANLS